MGDAVEAGCQLLDALAHAHERGVLHRDIKPGNVMCDTRGGRVRHVLIDFGLAHLMEAMPLTASGICPGTPAYTAPERLLGEPYDGRADLYSLGILLYEVVTGVRPFGGGSPARIAQLQIELVPPALRTLVQAPAALDAVVMRALRKKPAERFANALSMRAALDSVRGELSIGEEESTLEKVDIVRRRNGFRRLVHRLLRPFRPELPTTIPTLEMTTG
jgi:serine/threonine-protein kinase